VNQRNAVGKAGWNPALKGKEQTIDDLMFTNYLKKICLDSDTKVACISGAPSEIPEDWFLTNEMKVQARADVNGLAGSKRMFSHAIFTPGYDGWMEQVDHAIRELKPDSMKGYTIGDNTHKELSKHAWRLDDEKLVYPAYERFAKAGLRNVCVHKGLFPPSVEKQFPHLLAYSDVRDVGKAAKDWPQLNFIIYHGAYRFAGGGTVDDAWAQFERTGRIEWVSDLADVPAKYGVRNVYADVGQLFAQSTIADPRVSAVMVGQLIKALGADHVCWGTDGIWTGSPQWQIEALRRLEIPEELQRKYGLAPLGPADGPIKTAISAATTRGCTTSSRSSARRWRPTGWRATRSSTQDTARDAPTSRTATRSGAGACVDLHLEQRVRQRLAVRVERERRGDAAGKRMTEHELQRMQPRQLVAAHLAFADAGEMRAHGVRGNVAHEQRVVLGTIGDQGQDRRVAFVARAAVREVIQLRHDPPAREG
jgi:predicted TIM-barrel fold metal-dependent hydrolase